MRTSMRRPALLAGFLLLLGGLGAADPVKQPGPLVVRDAAGAEQKLTAWKFLAGTRHLTWLAPPAEAPAEPKTDAPKGRRPARPVLAKVGPEALAFRETDSTNFVDGVLTLVPLGHLRSVTTDEAKQEMAVKVAGPKEDITLTGSTRFRGINKLALEADVDRGDKGVASLRLFVGSPRGLQSLQFPEPKPTPEVTGRVARVALADAKAKVPLATTDLQALYLMPDGRERLLPELWFKKTFKVEIARIRSVVVAEEPAAPGDGPTWKVTLDDGKEETLTLLTTATLDGKPAVLQGLLGKVPAGYKLFPPHTLREMKFESSEPGN